VWLGYEAGVLHPKESRELFSKLAEDFVLLKDIPPLMMFAFILINNAGKSLAMVILGTFFGILPILFVSINGLLVGVAAYVVIEKHDLSHFLAGTLPHGIIEVLAFCLAGAYGMQLGKRYYRKLRGKDDFRPYFFRAIKNTFKYVFPLLALASFIEIFITRAILNAL